MDLKEPQIITGGIHTDDRGSISFVNGFSFSGVKRFYSIFHPTTEIIRAWQGHQVESKWFFVCSGSFKIVLVKIADWNKPDCIGQPMEFHLDVSEPRILFVPGGYVNGFQARSPESRILVFSDATVEESMKDDFRFDNKLWYSW